MRREIMSGSITLQRTYNIEEFDEDDGFVIRVIIPGTYKYRVLNINGWKPRQLLINDSWVDVCDAVEELERMIADNAAEPAATLG